VANELRQADPPLTAAEWRLWSLLVTLDPFGDRYQDLPDLLEIMQMCDMSKPTFYRAIAKFEELNLFDSQPLQIAFRNLRGQKIVSNLRQQSQKRDNSLKNETIPHTDEIERPPELFQDKGFKNDSKVENVPIVLKDFKKQKHTKAPPTHPVPDKNEQEKIGTLLQPISESGIRINKTIQHAVAIATHQEGAAAAALRIQKALSAVKEQQDRGNCRNPGGMFVAAMRKGFTANEQKGTRKQPPDLDRVAIAIDQALRVGDRAFARTKLQSLWAEGWHEELRELCYLRKDWGFRLHQEGVTDAKAPEG
jgi:hypothetical protein